MENVLSNSHWQSLHSCKSCWSRTGVCRLPSEGQVGSAAHFGNEQANSSFYIFKWLWKQAIRILHGVRKQMRLRLHQDTAMLVVAAWLRVSAKDTAEQLWQKPCGLKLSGPFQKVFRTPDLELRSMDSFTPSSGPEVHTQSLIAVLTTHTWTLNPEWCIHWAKEKESQ